jgi:hypothetical protein
VALLYPDCYKKQKGTQFWDGYDVDNIDHEVVWIDEMSKETLECLTGKAKGGFEFLKELGDRYPVTVDAKYIGSFKIRPKKILITMNEHPHSLLPDRAIEVNKQALNRKFKVMHVSEWLQYSGLQLGRNGAEFIPEITEDWTSSQENEIRLLCRAQPSSRQEESSTESCTGYQGLQSGTEETLQDILSGSRRDESICREP